jgi:4-amino-4-deoxy-L-arabinose transferase-like glycosyltransferase
VSTATRARLGAVLDRPVVVLAAGAVLLVAVFQLWITPSNPPGFIRDEASFALNAYTIAHHLRDQDGGFLPLYFVSFGDYKSPLFVYLLAPLLRVFGAHAELARGLGAVDVLAAVLLVGWLAFRRTRRLGVSAAILVLAGTTPWLFELGRVAFDTTLYPLATCVALAVVGWIARSSRLLLLRCAAVGAALGGVTYCYAAGRALAVLLALALLVFAARERRGWIVGCWLAFAVSQLPLLVYSLRHPGGLTARYHDTTFVTPGMSTWTIVRTGVENYVHDLNFWRWTVSGDPKPYIHVWGAGQLYAALVVLAALGLWRVATRLRRDRWWWYVVATALAVPIPAAVTEDRYDSLRLAALPVVLAVLAIPGAVAVADGLRTAWTARLAAAALTAVTLAQFVHFYDVYTTKGGPSRETLFEAAVPSLLARALADGRTVYIDYDDVYAQTHARWYAAEHGLPASRVVRLPDGGAPPAGSMVFGRFQACDYACTHLAEADTYWIARAASG